VVGALVTALLFSLGKALIGLYLSASGNASAYGAAGSLVLVLLWICYSARVFLLGAEFTWVYANARGSRRAMHR
jgi:membrane protein